MPEEARQRLLAEELLDFNKRYNAIFENSNKEDDADSLLDDIRYSAIELAELVLATNNN